jgi:acetolactate synthase-1/2/3 large subunit
VDGLAPRLARILADRSDTLFGVPGGGPNLDVVGAATDTGMRFVLAHGESAAAIMASTYGLVTSSVAGVVVTRGPGAASAVNGVAQATLDRYPLVAITDTVPARQRDRVSHQLIDQQAMFWPVTKLSTTITNATSTDTLATAVDRSIAWPYGAVHLDYDAAGQAESGRPEPTPESRTVTAPSQSVEPPKSALPLSPAPGDEAVALLLDSRRPLVIVGMEAAAAGPPVVEALERLGCPVLTTYQAVGLVPTEGSLHAGIYTNGALEQPTLDSADLILTIGLDTVEPIPTPWQSNVPVVRISSTAAIDEFVPVTVDLMGPPAAVAAELGDRLADRGWSPNWPDGAAARLRTDARARLRPGTGTGPVVEDETDGARFGPLELVDTAARFIPDGVAEQLTVTVDAGAHFLAVMPNWPVTDRFRLLISNGLATMGFALPAAIGAALARPGKPVLAFTGDGGLAMTMAELETMARLELPITVVVFNDAALSLIAIKQQDHHGGEAAIRYRLTDFATIAVASGLGGTVVESPRELAQALARDWTRPRLIDARIDPTDYHSLLAATRG